MLRISAWLILMMSISNPTYACDACGCSINATGIGLMAIQRQSFWGLQFQSKTYQSKLKSSLGAKDYFNNFEAAFRFQWKPKFSLQLSIPYGLNIRNHPDGNARRNGFGDSRLMGNFILLNTRNTVGKYKVTVEMGSGIKLPNGMYDANIHTHNNLPENFNIGNGSWAGLLSANVQLNTPTSGLVFITTGMVSLRTKEGYRFGNQWTGMGLYYKNFPVNKLNVKPFTGLQGEWIQQDQQLKNKLAVSTGGKGLFIPMGIHLSWNDWNLSGAYTLPLAEHYSNAEVSSQGKWNIQFSQLLNFKKNNKQKS